MEEPPRSDGHIPVTFFDWGTLPFEEARARQLSLVEDLRRREAPDRAVCAFVEHPPVFTLGRFARPENVLRPGEIPVVGAERGGDVTYHGPGQVVVYVFVRLFHRGWSVRTLVHRLEGAIIAAAANFGVLAGRRAGYPGVWCEDRKLASIGLALSRGVTYHGFALNVNNDLEPYERIHPCGLRGVRMTSLQRELGHAVEISRVKDALARHLILQLS